MTERLWGHDAIRIEIPYAVAKVIASPGNPDRRALLRTITETLAKMIAESSLIEPSPIAVVLDGILTDGADMSMGPCVYVRKVFMDDVMRNFATLRAELDL